MPSRRPKVIPFSRDYRRVEPFGMGLPPKRRRRRRAAVADPRVYLKWVIGIAAAALIALPFGADAVNAVLAPGTPQGCRVVSVVDGDTVRMWCPARGLEKARLMGFDTPEVFSPSCAGEFAAGVSATWRLRWLLFRAQEVSLVRRGTDRYGRALVVLYLDGRNVAQTMISDGVAKAYSGGKRGSWCR